MNPQKYSDPRERPHRKPWARRQRRMVQGVIVLFVAPVVLFASVRVISDRNFKARLEAIRAGGFPATLEELQQWQIEEPSAHAPLSPDMAREPVEMASTNGRTAVDLYQAAIKALTPQQFASADAGKILDKYSKDEPLSPEDWVQLRDFVSAIPEVLTLLHEAAALPPGRFPVDYSKGYAVELPHLAGIRNIARTLRAEALIAAHDGSRDDAFAAVMAGIAASRPLRHEPILISQLVRIACNRIMVDALSDTMGLAKFTEAQLRQLQHAFDEAHYPLSLRNALAGERVFAVAVYRAPTPVVGRTFLDDVVPGATDTLLRTAAATGWFNRDANQCLVFFDEMVRASTLPYPEAVHIFSRIGEKVKQPTILPRISQVLIPSLFRAADAMASEKARLLQAATAAAIARYQLEHGAPPKQLDVLVPVYIRSVPEDPFDLQPMRYRREEDSYLLYSIGPNGKDDDGTRGRSEMEGDLVFRPRNRLLAEEQTLHRNF